MILVLKEMTWKTQILLISLHSHILVLHQMNNDKHSRLIHKFLEMIENDSELLLTSGLESFLKNNNIPDGINFINEVLNH